MGQDENVFELPKEAVLIGDQECGSQASESQIYDWREGKVEAINSANEVAFEQSKKNGNRAKGRFVVKLAGIDVERGPYSNPADNLKAFLVKNILGKKLTVFGNTEQEGDRSFYGVLWSVGFGDVNLHLLESGMAEYKEPPYFYGVSRTSLCEYERAAKQAEAAKLGIWAN